MANFEYSSIFGNLTKVVGMRFDAVSKLNKELFDNVIFTKYMTWDTPDLALNFQEVIGSYNITTAAATIGDDSKEPVIGVDAPAVVAQRVLHHAITRKMTAQTFRKILLLRNSRILSDTQLKNELIDQMWGEVTFVVNGVLSRLDMIFLDALSNEGIATLDSTNNPEGGVRDTINYGMPDANKFTADKDWSEENSEDVDILGDIAKVVHAAEDYVVFDRILADPAVITYACQSAKVRMSVWGSDRSASMVTPVQLNQYLVSIGLPQLEPIRRQVRVMDNGTLRTVKPWNANNIVFIPGGSLGLVKNAYLDNEAMPEPGVAYSNYGRVRVSQWSVGETSASSITEFTKAEALALPVFTEIDGIYSLNTQPSQTASPTSAGVSTLSADTASTASKKSKE